MPGTLTLASEFATNIAIVITLAFLYGVGVRWLDGLSAGIRSVANGALFGSIAIVSLEVPLKIDHGMLFDGRNIIVMLAGPYAGPVAGAIAGLAAGAYRVSLGGVGVYGGTAAILSATAIGIAYYYIARKKPSEISILALLVLAVLMTVVSAAWFFVLPGEVANIETFERLAPPLALIHVIATVLVGLLLSQEFRTLELLRKLQSSEKRLIASQKLANMGDFMWEIHSGRVQWSEGLYALLGYDRREPIDFDFVTTRVHHPEDLPLIEAWLEDGIKSGRENLGFNTYRLLHRDGSVIHTRVDARLEMEHGRAVRVYGSCLDVTEIIEKSTELMKARDEAEQASRAKSEFLAKMSHEFRTPLNAILGFSDILANRRLMQPDQAKSSEYAGDIHASAKHLLALVNEMLDLSEIEAGKREIDPQSFPCAGAVGQCIRVVAERAAEKGVDLAMASPPDAASVYADRRCFHQILLNLLSNAIKFTPAGGRVTVAATEEAAATRIVVSDTGVGIPSDRLPKVTAMFERTEVDPFKSDKGWGLGLAITQALVDMHGGTLEIESGIGTGTTVTVMFPVRQLPDGPSP